ncbi:nuclease-related domain-containing protein [Pseudalkalibacillus sp. Hm43]|uniref:nuclease-related domain-containing protein n=1 Tax=Pseudalkalibacillus sp. Hm43 TaxID=3450742 RepID=UPI003F42D782
MQLMKPIPNLQLISLLYRSPAKDPAHQQHNQILTRLNNLEAGFYGEEQVAYQLRYLPKGKFKILHNIRLSYQNLHFQIDFLLLSPHFHLILEVKNIIGELDYDPVFQQLVWTKIDGTRMGLGNPISQAQLQKRQFTNWLKKYNLPIAPIYYLSVMSNPKTILKTSPNHQGISKLIIHKHSLLQRIENLLIGQTNESISKNDVTKIARKIKKKNEPLFLDVLSKYNFTKRDMQGGVQCLQCKTLPIPKKENRTIWNCPACGIVPHHSYESAITDFVLLYTRHFSNKELREFLGLTSASTVYKLLKKMDIQTVGRKHIFPVENIQKFAQKDFINE